MFFNKKNVNFFLDFSLFHLILGFFEKKTFHLFTRIINVTYIQFRKNCFS